MWETNGYHSSYMHITCIYIHVVSNPIVCLTEISHKHTLLWYKSNMYVDFGKHCQILTEVQCYTISMAWLLGEMLPWMVVYCTFLSFIDVYKKSQNSS